MLYMFQNQKQLSIEIHLIPVQKIKTVIPVNPSNPCYPCSYSPAKLKKSRFCGMNHSTPPLHICTFIVFIY